MAYLSIVHHYLLWHYTRAWHEIFEVWLNYLWFVVNFFSIPQLVASWLSPFKRIVEERGNTWNLEDLANWLIIGIISRIIGAFLRTIIIGVGLIALLITAVLGFVTIALWVVMPLLIVVMLVFGITLLFA